VSQLFLLISVPKNCLKPKTPSKLASKPKLVSLFLFLFFFSIQGYAGYDVNDRCKNAWMTLMDLDISGAKKILSEELQLHPDNYYAMYLDQTCDLFSLLINSSKEEYEAFISAYEKKREVMDGHDEESPYYLVCSAEMQLQVTVMNVMNGAQLSAMRKGYSAYRKVYKNLERFPSFQPNLKLDGFFNVALDNLPPFVKWAISFFGVSVDRQQGFEMLEKHFETVKNETGINAEAAMYMILAAKINKTPEKVYAFVNSLPPEVANARLIRYFRANIAYRTGRNEQALRILSSMKVDGNPEAQLLYHYLMGKILLRKLDIRAKNYINQYIRDLKKREYLKEEYYNLALCYLLEGKTDKYEQTCKTVEHIGMDLNERDREALYDARLDYLPNLDLVKARLSLAGGYDQVFLKMLAQYEANPSDLLPHQLEYHFLKGQYDVRKGKRYDAINQFKWVIEHGEDEDYYFASEASLLLGTLYQNINQVSLAKEYYKLALKLYRSDFYEYIEDKARKAEKKL
jgi:hypothetical protein